MNHSLIFEKILYYPKKININEFSFENDYKNIPTDDINNGIIRFEKNGELIGEGFIYQYNSNEYISVYNQFGVLKLINLKDKANIYSYTDMKNMTFKRNTLTNEEYEFIIGYRLLTLFYKVIINNEEYLTNKLFDIEPKYSLYLKKHVFTYKGRNIYEYDVYRIDDDYYLFLIARNDKKDLTYLTLDIDYACLRLTNFKKDYDGIYIKFFNEYLNEYSISNIYKSSNIEYVTNLALDILNENEEFEELIHYLNATQFKGLDLFFYK